MALILGIDPGSRVTGYGVIRALDARQEYITSGCIRTTGCSALPERLDIIFQDISRIIREHAPQELAVERIFMARSADAALKLGHARGVALLAAVHQGVPVYEYDARKIKQAVAGSGAATKPQVRYMVARLLGLPKSPGVDAADALATAICHVNTRRSLARMAETGAAGAGRFRRGRLAEHDS